MRLFATILASATLAMANASSVVHKKEVTVKLYHHKGLSLPAHCENALVTGFLVAFNTISAKQTHSFEAMNLKISEQYFEFENDDIAVSSTAWIQATFDASCESCDFNDNDPPLLFRNTNGILSDSVVHHDIEMELLRFLKDGKMCAAFQDLQDVEVIYKPNRRQALAAATPGNEVSFQQAVSATMDGINKGLIDLDECQAALSAAWMTAIDKTFRKDIANSVQGITVDSFVAFPSQSQQLDGERPSTNRVKSNLRAPLLDEEENEPAEVAHGQYRAHLDIKLPQETIGSIVQDRVFCDKKASLALAAQQADLERAMAEALRSNSTCAAFEFVSNLAVHFHGKYVPPTAALTKGSDEEIFQATTVMLENVDLAIPPSDTCNAIFQSALISSYNKAHPEQDTLFMNSAMLHSADYTPMDHDDRRNLQFIPDSFFWFMRFNSFLGGICRFCRPNVILNSAASGQLNMESFSGELIDALKTSDCKAFQNIKGVSIEFVESFSPPMLTSGTTMD